MNSEQVKSALRTLVATFGGSIAGFFVAKGWFTTDQVMSILTSEAFLGVATSAVVGAWGIWAKTRNNLLVTAATVTDDKGDKIVKEMKLSDPQVAAEVNPQVSARVVAVKESREKSGAKPTLPPEMLPPITPSEPPIGSPPIKDF